MINGVAIVSIITIGVIILIMRLVGAWMLRINDVISELKLVNEQLLNLRNKQ